MPLKPLSISGNWIQVEDLDGERHWVHRRLLTRQIRCAVVRVDNTALLTGPGSSFERAFLDSAMRYESFYLLDQTRAWVKLQDRHGIAWARRQRLWIK